MTNKKPEITVFAGPNGSGKSTVMTASPHVVQPYINADDIKRTTHCNDIKAATDAEEMRRHCVERKQNFSFETVLSTDRNLDLLRRAKENGYFIRGIFVLTAHPELNVMRVEARAKAGGHSVPIDKIHSRYYKSIDNVVEFIKLCDVCHIYDNTEDEPIRIFKKKRFEFLCLETKHWSVKKIFKLIGKNID